MSSTLRRPRGRSILVTSRTSPPRPTVAGGEAVDGDLEGEDDGAGRVGWTSGGRAAGRPVEGRRAFGHELAGDELADQAADRAAGETRARDQVGTGQRSTTMELPDDRPQVRSADGLAPMPEVVSTDHHRVCVPLYQMSVRDWNNGPAVSSRVCALVRQPLRAGRNGRRDGARGRAPWRASQDARPNASGQRAS